jgi:hypothetical protein
MRRTRTLVAALALASLAAYAGPVRADDGKPDAKPAADAKILTWSSDYDAAKALAAKEKKGLLVYLTPDWFS